MPRFLMYSVTCWGISPSTALARASGEAWGRDIQEGIRRGLGQRHTGIGIRHGAEDGIRHGAEDSIRHGAEDGIRRGLGQRTVLGMGQRMVLGEAWGRGQY